MSAKRYRITIRGKMTDVLTQIYVKSLEKSKDEPDTLVEMPDANTVIITTTTENVIPFHQRALLRPLGFHIEQEELRE